MRNRIITKVYRYFVMAILMAAALASVAEAQSDRLVAANVPFNFYVKDRALPAGQYTFALVQVAGADALKIQSADGHLTVIIPTRAFVARGERVTPHLVFNQYEDRYFLAQVSGLEERAAQQIAKSQVEEEMARNTSTPDHRKVSATARRP